MGISGIAHSLSVFLSNAGPSVRELTHEKQAQQLIEDVKPSPISLAESPEYGRSNLMSGNYADLDQEKSKYLAAAMKSFETERTFKNKLDSIITMLKAGEGGKKSKYSDGHRMGLKAKKYLQRLEKEEIIEKSQEHLKDNRENLTEAAQADRAVLDQNGNPLPEPADMESGSTQASTDKATPALEAPMAAQISVDVTV